MNLFEIYSNEIKTIVKKNRNFFNLNNKNFINNIIVENPLKNSIMICHLMHL